MKSLTSSVYLSAEPEPLNGVTVSVFPESISFDESDKPQSAVIKVAVFDGDRAVHFGGTDGFTGGAALQDITSGSLTVDRVTGTEAMTEYGCQMAFKVSRRPRITFEGTLVIKITYRGIEHKRDIPVVVTPAKVRYAIVPSLSFLHFQRNLMNEVTGTNELSVQVRKDNGYSSKLLGVLYGTMTMGWSFDGGTVTKFAQDNLVKTITEKEAYGHQRFDLMLYEENTLIDKMTLPIIIDGLNGAEGKPGAPGAAGPQGLDGCILQTTEWEPGVTYRNDTAVVSNVLRILNFVTVQADSGWKWTQYMCMVTHQSSADNKPGTTGGAQYWVKMQEQRPMCTPAIFAEYARFRFTQTNQILLVRKQDGKDVVYMGIGGKDYPLWAGGETPESTTTNFRLGADGRTYQRGSTIEGDIFCVGPGGMTTRIQGGGLSLHLPNIDTPSLRTGIDDDGELVIQVYDKTGKFCYDLGPKGFPKLENKSLSWTDVYMRRLPDTDPWKDTNNINRVNFTASDRRYRYHSATINNVKQDPDNDDKIFKHKRTDSVIEDGWYSVGYDTGRPMYNEVKKDAEGRYIIHPAAVGAYNANDPLRSPLVQTYIYQYADGKVKASQLVYFNIPTTGGGGSLAPDWGDIIIRPTF